MSDFKHPGILKRGHIFLFHSTQSTPLLTLGPGCFWPGEEAMSVLREKMQLEWGTDLGFDLDLLNPELVRKAAQGAARNLAACVLALLPVEEGVLAYLSLVGGQAGTQDQIAQAIGKSRSHVTKAISRLREAGWLETAYGSVKAVGE